MFNKFLVDIKWKKFVHALKEDIIGEINPEIKSNDYFQSFANDMDKELGHVNKYYEKEFYHDHNENDQSIEISNLDCEYESEDYEAHLETFYAPKTEDYMPEHYEIAEINEKSVFAKLFHMNQ